MPPPQALIVVAAGGKRCSQGLLRHTSCDEQFMESGKELGINSPVDLFVIPFTAAEITDSFNRRFPDALHELEKL